MQPGPIGGYIKSTLHGDVHGAKDLAFGLTIGWLGPCLLLRSIFASIEEFSYFSPLRSRILLDKNLSYSHQLGIVQRYFGQKEKFSNFTIRPVTAHFMPEGQNHARKQNNLCANFFSTFLNWAC